MQSARGRTAPVPLGSWYSLGALVAAAILSYTDRQILTLLVDPIRADLKISDTQLSLLQGAAFAVIYAIAGLPAGRWADRLNRRNLIIGGMLLWSVSTAAAGFADSFAGLFVSRLFVGIGEAVLAPAALSLIGDLFPPRRRAVAVSIFLAGMTVGAGLAVVAGGLLLELANARAIPLPGFLADMAPWRIVLLVAGAPGLLMALLLLTLREPGRGGNGLEAPPSRSQILSYFRAERATLLPLYAAIALLAVVDFAALSWLPALLMRNFGESPAEAGTLVGLIAIGGGAAGLLIGGAVADRLRRRSGDSAGLLVCALALTMAVPLGTFGLWGSTGAVAVCLVGYTLLSGAANGTGISMLTQTMPPSRMRGIAAALAAFLNIILGLGLGPTLVALATDHLFQDERAVGLSLTLVAMPTLSLASILIWSAWRSFRRAQDSADGETASRTAGELVPTREE